jgi:hypothetical protein
MLYLFILLATVSIALVRDSTLLLSLALLYFFQLVIESVEKYQEVLARMVVMKNTASSGNFAYSGRN